MLHTLCSILHDRARGRGRLRVLFALLLGATLIGTSVLAPPTGMAEPWISSSAARREIASRVATTVTAPHEIEIDLRYGLCVLTGRVDSARDREIIEGIARSQKGVREVRNELTVGESETTTPPSATASQIERRLADDSSLEGYRVEVSLKDGLATVRGSAQDTVTRDRIENLIAATEGVTQVKSFVEIRPPPDDTELRRELRAALARNEKIDLDTVSFDVQDGVAIFRGDVDRHDEIDRILSVALMVEGIRDIRSEVHVAR